MPTKKAKQTEREMMDQDVDAVAVLMVMDDGRARLKDIIITPNGKKRSNDENFDENGYTDDNESIDDNESLEEPDKNIRLQDQR